MLCESLALLLIEDGVLSKHQVIDAIEGVIEVKREIAGTSEPVVVSVASILLLQTIRRSISATSSPEAPIVAA